jgi:hypothetical protein
VVYQSYCEVNAENAQDACALALEDHDYADAEGCSGSESATWIESIELDLDKLIVPRPYREEDVDG